MGRAGPVEDTPEIALDGPLIAHRQSGENPSIGMAFHRGTRKRSRMLCRSRSIP